MPDADLRLLIDAAHRAGEIATAYTGPAAERWDKPDGAGPVTEADLAVNRMLEDRLRTSRPDYGWLSEESEDDGTRLSRERVFIIDPIDGTRSFADGSRTWAHALAIAENGVVTDAVIYLPMRDFLYTATRGGGAFLNGEPIGPSGRKKLRKADVLATRPVMEPRNWRGPVPEFRRAHRPSLAYRMALVAQGRYDAMLTLRPAWEWDIAPGDLILREAGARVSDRHGDPLRFNKQSPLSPGVVAGGSAMQAALLDALADRPGSP